MDQKDQIQSAKKSRASQSQNEQESNLENDKVRKRLVYSDHSKKKTARKKMHYIEHSEEKKVQRNYEIKVILEILRKNLL